MIIIYAGVLLSLSIYSFALIDPNITFFQTRGWEIFREKLVYFGYYERQNSWVAYFSLVIVLFAFHYFFVKKYKQFNPIRLAIIIGVILLISYPFLSHDFLNYMFDARIITFYRQNPYFYKALDFPDDYWLRFLQWTHRTYPYGPVFLLITLIPSFFSLGKFVLSFLFFKSTFVIFYFLAVFYLNKLNKKFAVVFATHPLIIIEGLVNSHNDLIAVSLGIIGIYYLLISKALISRLFFLLSIGIKFITFPILLLTKSNKRRNKFIFTFLIGVIVYLSIKSEIQPWYFLNLFIFLPLLKESINTSILLGASRLNIFFFGLLISYYPYIRLGGWDTIEKVELKHGIIGAAEIFNLLYFFYFYYLNRNNSKEKKNKK